MNNRRIVACALAGASLAVLASPALAQESASIDNQAAQDIIVTGSRIVRNGDDMPVPMTVVSNDSLQDVSPTTISEGLKILPVFAGSRGQFSNPSAGGGVGAGNGSAAQLNLRNIGAERTLVLMDGRRVPPSSNTNFVDIDMVPQQLVQRVETVTGGVSAVYGSDAVSGVVNFIIDKNFNGLKGHAQYGISDYGDGGAFNAGAAFGTSFADGRGHIELSYEYRDDKGVSRRSSRPWFNQPGVSGNGGTIPYELVENLRLSAYPFGGRITCGSGCSLNGQYFAANGVLSAFTSGSTTSPAGYSLTGGTQVGGDGGYQDMSLKSALESHQIYARVDYDITDHIAFFASAAGNIKRNEFYSDTLRATNLQFSSTNAFLSADYQAALAAAGADTFTLSGLYDGVRLNAVPRTNNWMFVTGLTGDVSDYHWEVSYTRGMSKLHTTMHNVVNAEKFAAALDAVDDGTGNIICRASLTNAAYSDCVPLNLFGPSPNADGLAYALGDIDYVAKNYLDDVLFTFTGSPFSTWAGDAGIALSAEWRNQAFRANSSAEPTDLANCAGLLYNCSSSAALWSQTFPSADTVNNNVWEVAGEVELPLLKDAPFAQSFVLNGAARYTSYKTSGNYWTWKGGFDWRVNDSIRFRGTISRDIRAPTLADLYAATSVVVGDFDDTLTGASDHVASINYGNDQLKAEIGKTWTAGMVLTPTFLPGFSLAVDYYHIKISNAITTVQGFRPYIQNACYDSGGTSPYCDLIERPSYTDTNHATNTVTAYYVTNVNIAEIETEGVDIEANYNTSLFGQPLTLRGLAAYQPHAYYRQPAIDTADYGGVAFGPTGRTATPTWRLTGVASFKPTDNLRVDILQTWRNAMKGWVETSATNSVNNHIAAFGSTTLNLSWQVPTEKLDDAEFFLNISNLFNNDPPAANSAGSAGSIGGFNGFVVTDDAMGRYFTAGFRIKM